MASTSLLSLSSSLYGTHLRPKRPKTTRSVPLLFHHPRTRPNSVQSFLLPPRNKKSMNSRNNSNSELTPSVNAAVASFLLSTLAHQQPLSPALAEDLSPPPASPPVQMESATKPSPTSSPFSQSLLTAPKPQSSPDLPEGSQWRYSEFLNAVKKGKVERVRFSKDGGALQLTAVDGRRATVVVPNDPDLIDILAMNGVDISVSEGDGGNGLFAFIGNLLFPFLAFAGLFFLFRRAQGGPGGGPGGLGGPMDFGRSNSKFQEDLETGVTFANIVSTHQTNKRGGQVEEGSRRRRRS